MAYTLTVAGYTFENPPEEYRKLARVGNSPQPAVDKEATDFYQSDTQDLQLQVEGTLALDPPLGETQDDLAELERLQQIAIEGGEVDVEFDPFFSGKCIIEDDPFRQSDGESSYSFTFTVNQDTTDSTAYPARSPPDTGNTFELGSLDIGYDPESVAQNYERQTESVKRLQGVARSIDNAGLIPKVKVSGMIDGEGQATLWQKARDNVLAYLSAEFQKGWCLIDSLSIRNNPEAPDYLDGLFQYDLDVFIVKDPGSGIGSVSSYVDQTVKESGTYAGDQDSGDSDFTDLEFTVDGGSGSLDGDYIEWNQTTLTLSDNDTNYVYVDDADSDGYGTVKANQSAFPADAVALYRVETSGGEITKVVDVRAILLDDRTSEEGGDDGGETVAGDVYFTVFGGDYEIADGTTSSWNDTRLLLASNDRNYIWVEDDNLDGSAQVNTATSGYPSSGNFIQMYRVDTDADSVTNIIDDRPSDINDSGTDTSSADLNLSDDLRVRDQNLDFERLLALADTLSVTESGLLPALGLVDLAETLAVADGPLDATGQASLSDTLALVDGGTASFSGGGSTTDETITWGTATDWDNAVSETGVVHESFGDLPGADVVQIGQPSFDEGGSNLAAYFPLDEDSGSAATDVTGNLSDGNISSGVSIGVSGGLHNSTKYAFPSSGGDRVNLGAIDFLEGVSELTIIITVTVGDLVDERGYVSGGFDGTYIPFELGCRFGQVYAGCYDNTQDGWYRFLANSSSGTKHRMAGVFDSGDIYLYLDGSQAASGTFYTNTTPSSSARWAIGNRDQDGSWTKNADADIDGVEFYDRAFTASEIQDDYDELFNGDIITATKSFSESVNPTLTADVNLNGTSDMQVDVIGSPGTGSEETITVSVTGSGDYSLSFASEHTDFRVKAYLDNENDETNSQELIQMDLTGSVASSVGQDDDQNPNTSWEILGAEYDTSGNEYEGGGVVSRYGAD